eukprot:TRINITY_DN23537_c0_g1_i1.p1 TRINITY_DN23537_c0_g1~~TRINITY_DN23537_c0_g1_i1.p1  ORF type:complete len:199 (+),score=48.58 TRINITY_DN23537_c0_g1_i1:68-664(+)
MTSKQHPEWYSDFHSFVDRPYLRISDEAIDHQPDNSFQSRLKYFMEADKDRISGTPTKFSTPVSKRKISALNSQVDEKIDYYEKLTTPQSVKRARSTPSRSTPLSKKQIQTPRQQEADLEHSVKMIQMLEDQMKENGIKMNAIHEESSSKEAKLQELERTIEALQQEKLQAPQSEHLSKEDYINKIKELESVVDRNTA